MDSVTQRAVFALPLYVRLIAWRQVLGIVSLALLLCVFYSGLKMKQAYEHEQQQSLLRLKGRLEHATQSFKELESLLTLIGRRLVNISSADKITLALRDHYIQSDSPLSNLSAKGNLYWVPQRPYNIMISSFGRLPYSHRPSSHFLAGLLNNPWQLKVTIEGKMLYCGVAVLRDDKTLAGFLFFQIPLHDIGSALTSAKTSRILALTKAPASSLVASYPDTPDYGLFKSPYCMDNHCYGSFLKLPSHALLVLFEEEVRPFLALFYQTCGQAWELMGIFSLTLIIALLYFAKRSQRQLEKHYSNAITTLTETSQNSAEQLHLLEESHHSLIRQHEMLTMAIARKDDLTQQLASFTHGRLAALIQRISDVRFSLQQQLNMPVPLILSIITQLRQTAEDIHLTIIPNAVPQSLSIGALLEHTISRHLPELEQKGITVHLDVPAENDRVLYDRLFLTLLFENLFIQSLKRTPSNGTLSLTVSSDDSLQCLTFHDSGFVLTEDAHMFFDSPRSTEKQETPPFALSNKALDWMIASIGASLSSEYIGRKGNFMRLTFPASAQTALSEDNTAKIIPFSSLLKTISESQHS